MSCALSMRMASKICRTISGAKPSDGSSSSNSRGRLISARAIASICCSPPDSVPPRWREPLLEARKQRQHAFEVAVEVAVVGDGRAHLQIFQHRHAREDAAAFRSLRQFQAGDLVRRHAGDIAAVEVDRAFARARVAADCHHQRRLAGAVGADQRDDLAVVDVEVDALERLYAPVKRGHAAHREKWGAHRPTSASTSATSSSSTPR